MLIIYYIRNVMHISGTAENKEVVADLKTRNFEWKYLGKMCCLVSNCIMLNCNSGEACGVSESETSDRFDINNRHSSQQTHYAAM